MICNKIYKTLVFTGLKTTLIHNKRHKTSFITFNVTFFSQKSVLSISIDHPQKIKGGKNSYKW